MKLSQQTKHYQNIQIAKTFQELSVDIQNSNSLEKENNSDKSTFNTSQYMQTSQR